MQQALTESNAERGTLRSRLNAADITVTQLQKRVQVQHTQRVDMSVELAAARGEVESANQAQVAAEARVAGIEDTNKRIELTGTLLNNLFRNYFNKMVKEIQKQVVREINNGSWRSSEDYENIINMTISLCQNIIIFIQIFIF